MAGWILDNREELKRLNEENIALKERVKLPDAPRISCCWQRRFSLREPTPSGLPSEVQEIYGNVMEFRGATAKAYRQAVEAFLEANRSGIQKHNRHIIVDRIRQLVADRFDRLTRQQAFPELNDEMTRDALYAWAVEDLAAGELRVQGQQGASAWLHGEARRMMIEA